MASASTTRATIADLYRTEGRAELVGGRIIPKMPSGELPTVIAGNIFISLHAYARASRRGKAYADNLGYTVPELASGRESFSPDASYYDGPLPANRMRFIEGPPTLAVEVRSENDYGPAAEAALAAKRTDYFEAGTVVVWDVDPLAKTVRVYRASGAANPTVFQGGQLAEAEPAVPGWTMAVDEIFGG